MKRYCHACNRRNQHCWQSVYLTGKLYDHDSHAIEPVSRESSDNYDDDDGDDEDKDDDEDEDEDDEDEALPRSFHMGKRV